MTEETWVPLVLAVAPNGARKTQADHPAVPLSPREIASTAAACVEAGAAMLHLHVRDAEAAHSLDPELYRQAIAAVRAEVGDALVIQATTEAVGRNAPQEQMQAMRDLQPEAVSLAVRELVPDESGETAAAEFFAWLAGEGILAQYILYSAEDLQRFDRLRDAGVVPDGGTVLFVLGRYTAGQRSDPQDLLPFLTANRRGHPWFLCAFGAKEIACAAAATALGGHARVGFENNLLLPDGSVAPDNAALVAAAAKSARCLGRPLADSATARRLLRGL